MKIFLEKNEEVFKEIIDLIGEEKIEKASVIVGKEKFSFSAVMNYLRNRKIAQALRDGVPPGEVAIRYRIAKGSVYRRVRSGSHRRLKD